MFKLTPERVPKSPAGEWAWQGNCTSYRVPRLWSGDFMVLETHYRKKGLKRTYLSASGRGSGD